MIVNSLLEIKTQKMYVHKNCILGKIDYELNPKFTE